MIYKCALIQRHIPHYRLPFFKKLYNYSEFSWDFIAGHRSGKNRSGLPIAKINELPIKKMKVNYFLNNKMVFESGIMRHILENHYKVIVFELGWQIISNISLILEAKRRKIPIIGWGKGIPSDGSKRSKLRRSLYESNFINYCDALIVYGNVSYEYFINLGCSPKKIFTAQNSIDVTSIIKNISKSKTIAKELKKKYGIEKVPVIGYFGRLKPQKQIDKLIKAYALAKTKGLKTKLLIAGDGPERSSLIDMSISLDCFGDIIFTGEIPVEKEGGYFQMFDLFISVRSGGLSIIEAMANGKPVLITPEILPETELIQDNYNGFISKGFHENDLVNSLFYIFSEKIDLSKVGFRGQKTVKKYATLENMIQVFDEAVRSVL